MWFGKYYYFVLWFEILLIKVTHQFARDEGIGMPSFPPSPDLALGGTHWDDDDDDDINLLLLIVV